MISKTSSSYWMITLPWTSDVSVWQVDNMYVIIWLDNNICVINRLDIKMTISSSWMITFSCSLLSSSGWIVSFSSTLGVITRQDDKIYVTMYKWCYDLAWWWQYDNVWCGWMMTQNEVIIWQDDNNDDIVSLGDNNDVSIWLAITMMFACLDDNDNVVI
jgi:hypothetical protein